MLLTPKPEGRYRTIGVMTGTSMDGIDTALVDFFLKDGTISYNLVEYQEYPFPESLKKKILYMLMGEISMQDISSVGTYISEIYAEAILDLLDKTKVKADEIDFLGCHGQTLWHQPNALEFCGREIRSTYQALDAPTLAHKTNIPVVYDFRSADIAAGGQGAPLVPVFDYYFMSGDLPRALLNIGGMSNITLLPPCCDRDNIRAFDTGPGNVMIDFAMKKLFDKAYDASGKTANAGNIISDLMNDLMRIPFIYDTPPKSTGREYFSEKYSIALLEKFKFQKKEDIINTLSCFTAKSIAENVKLYGSETKEIICSGGGAKNKFILNKIAEYLPECEIKTADDVGLNSAAKEAIAFAFLAVLFATDKPGNITSVTGASEEKVLGCYCP